jgi:hypothetical protein
MSCTAQYTPCGPQASVHCALLLFLPLSLPGFGRAYFSVAPSLFAHEDAAYILAYSVIMLNTDRHNNQVRRWWRCRLLDVW